MVVTNGDLGTIVAAIAEGRRIHRNLRSVVGYLVAGNISEILVVAGALVLLPELAVPLLPVQLLWVNLVTDGLPALALGVDDPAADPLRLRPDRGSLLSRRRLGELAVRAALIAGSVLTAGLVATRWGWADRAVRSELLLTLLGAHLLLPYAARAQRHSFEPGWWHNRVLGAAVLGSLLLQVAVFCIPQGRDALGLTALPPSGWALATGASLAAILVIDVVRISRTGRRVGSSAVE